MVGLIALVILVSSFLGMAVILFRKIEMIAEIPETIPTFGFKARILNIKEKVSNLKPSESFSSEIILQKILSKVRILSLKIEKKTSFWLQNLREKSMKKKENDKYWEELKESIDNEKEKECQDSSVG